VDFGEKGTEEITLPIFANTNDPVTFEIWSGKPWEEGSELLADCFYHKPPKWLVFQKESYALKEILRGRTSLYLATDDSFQLRGIRFQKLERAYKRQPVVECDSVYGDTYKVICGKLEGIGNNVSIVFEHMDFGTEGTEAVTMRYRTGRDFNPVQLRFSHAEGNHIQMIEAKKQEEYGEVTYTIEKIRGCGTLQFIFLPGSCFDFDWFEFHR
jgi:beta-galactosidase